MTGSQKDAMLSKTSLSPVSAGELAILLAPSTSLPMTADRKAIKDDIRRMRDGFITTYGHRGSHPDFYLSQVLSSYLSQEEMRQMIIEVWSEK